MQFHEYMTFRTMMARHGDESQRAFARISSADSFRKVALEWFAYEANHDNSDEFNQGSLAIGESIWAALDRPYYNVWPIAVSLCPSVKLNLRFSQVQLPFHAILLRFAKGHEPNHLSTALLFWPKEKQTIQVFCHFSDGADSVLTVGHAFSMEDTVEDWLVNLEKHGSELPEYQHAAGLLIVRLVVFIGLLSSGKDFVTPIVLAKDRAKYEASTDDQVKRWIEERAVRRAGKGFDVGKQLQLVHDSSPHWRNPHLCLFWTGEGRSKPIIKMRSGTIIQSVSMAEVPTGYLGPETSEDDRIEIGSTPRETISKRRRFKIMQRDGFRCQLCGASSDGGFTLHVDHKVPLAKGGSNEEDNLWTLCKPCNLGKSDSLL